MFYDGKKSGIRKEIKSRYFGDQKYDAQIGEKRCRIQKIKKVYKLLKKSFGNLCFFHLKTSSVSLRLIFSPNRRALIHLYPNKILLLRAFMAVETVGRQEGTKPCGDARAPASGTEVAKPKGIIFTLICY